MRSYREQKARLEKEVELRTQELAVQNKQLETMAQHVKRDYGREDCFLYEHHS